MESSRSLRRRAKPNTFEPDDLANIHAFLAGRRMHGAGDIPGVKGATS